MRKIELSKVKQPVQVKWASLCQSQVPDSHLSQTPKPMLTPTITFPPRNQRRETTYFYAMSGLAFSETREK